MMPQLRNGDYVPNGRGGFVHLEGTNALLMRALFRLQCRRGALPMLPQLGSRLHELYRARPDARQALASAYCAEALQELPVHVVAVRLTEQEDGRLTLAVELTHQGRMLQGEVSV